MTDRDRRAAEANARAHNARIAIPPRDEVNRYDRLSPDARALLEQFDELDVAEIAVTAQAAITRVRDLHREEYGICMHCTRADSVLYPCPTIEALDEPTPAPAVAGRPITEEEAAAVRAANLPPGMPITRSVIDEAMRAPGPATTQATEPREHCGHLAPTTLLTTRPTECVLRPGHQGSHADDRGCRWWPITDQEQPMPTCNATIQGPHTPGGRLITCTREAGHPENHVGPLQGDDGKVLWTDHNAGAVPHRASNEER